MGQVNRAVEISQLLGPQVERLVVKGLVATSDAAGKWSARAPG